MSAKASSGTRGLFKKHSRGCPNRKGRSIDCDCPWWGRYNDVDQSLSKWADTEVDPRQLRPAQQVLTRLKAAIDGGRTAAKANGNRSARASSSRIS